MIQNTTIAAMGRIKSSILVGRYIFLVIAAALLLISLFGGVVEAGISVVDLNETDLTETIDIDTEPFLNTGDSTNLNHDANNVVLTDVCEVYLIIDDDTCVGYEVYVDGVYQFTEGQGTTPDGYCAFYITEGTHTIEIRKNGCSASKTYTFQCGPTYRWISMPDYWCDCDECPNPPTVQFDQSTYQEGDTVHATVSSSHCPVYYEITDCSGVVRKSGSISSGSSSIYYTIPQGSTPSCCYWTICFYWDDYNPPLGPLGNGEDVAAGSYQCSKCYTFYVCPDVCYVLNKIDDSTCEGYKVYVDGVYRGTEGMGEPLDGYFEHYITEGTHTIEIRKNECSASKTYTFQCGTTYRWTSMPDHWCDCCVGPDLIIEDITKTPSSLCIGDSATFTITIKNIGTETADPSTVKYYVGGIYKGLSSVSSIAPGATVAKTYIYMPDTCGNFQFRAVADANGNVNECEEGNNDRQESFVVDGPDLIVRDIIFPTGTVCLGETITFVATIKNQGGCTADQSVVKYYVNNQYVTSDNVPSLSPGVTSNQTFTWTSSSCGSVSVKAIADANGNVAECNEYNNDRQETLVVDGPDLVIGDITLPAGTVCLGEPITFTVTVKNEGGCTAGSSIVRYYINGIQTDFDSVPGLSSGSTSSQTFTWTSNSCGSVSVKAIADVNDDVKECDENNNEKQKSIEVEGPDLIVEDIILPTGTVCLDQSTTITVTIKNQGGCDADQSIVEYYMDDQVIETDIISSLSPDATATKILAWTPTSCGTHTIKAVADANNNVKECNENNNETQKSIEVEGPDLIIQNITLPSGNVWLGNTINIEVTTKNMGKCPAEGPFTMTFYVDNNQVRSVTVNNLEADDTTISSFKWTPDTCGIFNIKAVADIGDNVDECDENNNEGTETVEVVQEIEIYDLSPADNVILSSNDVVFSWKSTVEGSAELYIKSDGEGEFTKITGESGLSHVVTTTLDRNKNYTWYAKSCGYDKCVESEVRSFYIDNGIVFLQNEYVFNIERDYDQKVTISVKNSDNEPHDLLLSASNPYEDIFLGFVGDGSTDKIITLHPDEVKDIYFVIHTQDAMLERYTISINLTNIGTENITDCAVAYLNVRWPNINFGVEEVSDDPLTLLKTVRVINSGDKLTDLSITVDEGLKNKVIIQPSLSHYTLESGVDIKVSPSWSEGVGVIQGNLIVEAAGETEELFLDFSCQEGKEIHEVTLDHPILYYDLKGAWCINRGHVEDTFELPVGVTQENVVFAYIGLHLNAGSSQTTSYDVDIGINDHAVGTLSNVIPKGYYEFDIDSSYLNYATIEAATNKYTLDTNMNSGYLTSLSDVRVVLCLDELKLYICAEDEAEAYNIAWGLPYIEGQSEDISVEIISPEEGSELEPGETLIKAIVTGDNDGKNLCRVRAAFSNSDDEIVLLDDGLHGDEEAGDDIYANTWNAEVGDYEITVTARNCKAEGYDIVHVSVDEPPILPVPYYNQGSTKWCSLYSISMILKYNNVDWEPWEIAAEYGKARDEALDSLDIAGVQGVGGIGDKIKSKFGLDAETRRFYGTDSTEEIDQYIKGKVDDGQPVCMGFTREKHAIVAVGYDESYIFLHDPSGAITHDIFNDPSDQLIAVPILGDDFNQKLIDGRSWAEFVTTLTITSPIDKPKTQGSVYMLDYDEGSYDGDLNFRNRDNDADIGTLRFDGTYKDGYQIVKVGDLSEERRPTKNDRMCLSFTVANPTSTQRDYAVKSIFLNRDTGVTIEELSSEWDLSVPSHSTYYEPGSCYANQLSNIDHGDYTLAIELFDDADTMLDSFHCKINLGAPTLIVTGGLPYYDEPLQVFFKGTEINGLQHPQVIVQNPYECTYIVEYWNDTNNNLVIDEVDEWETEETFNDKTTSESEFDLILENLPIGLYRVKIEGTDYVSNNFYVIFNVKNCGLNENLIENYWKNTYTTTWETGFNLRTGKYTKKIFQNIVTSHNDEELLLTMSSISSDERNDRPFTEDIAINNFAYYVNTHLNGKSGSNSPDDIKTFIENIKSGKKPDADCDGYATFLVALARSSGIPARLIIGVGDINEESFDWNHAWTEVYNHGNWKVWDCLTISKSFDTYEKYIDQEGPKNLLYDVFDEREVDRCPDYGPCDKSPDMVAGVIRCPANLHAYDTQGRHVGVNTTGGTDLEIPSAYYTGPDSDPESIVIFGQNEDIIFKIAALDVGELNFTLIQSTETKTTTLTYSNVSIIETTEATVDVSEANPTYTMEIDDDGDGTTDWTKEPDSIEITESICGDLNSDGTLTPADAAIALHLAATGGWDPAADMSGDNRITSLDALMILQAAADAIDL